MNPVLFVLAALASPPEGSDPAAADAPITYRVSVLEMDGFGWRRAHGEQLTAIRRPGRNAVWSAGRTLAPVLAGEAVRIVHDPKVVARPEATAEIEQAVKVPREACVERASHDAPADAPAPAAATEAQADDKLRAEVAGRRLDQGVLAQVAIENTWVATFHANGDAGSIPEVAHAQVDGEWLIPADGLLVVSLGAHTTPDGDGKAVVRERLAVIEANPVEIPDSASCPAEATAPRPENLPPLPEDLDLTPAPHAACCRDVTKPADAKGAAESEDEDGDDADDAPAAGLKVSGGAKGVEVADRPAALPMPTPPGRSMPRAFAPDGSPAPPASKEDEEVKPAAAEPSAEPHPSPQADRPRLESVKPTPSPSSPPSIPPKADGPPAPDQVRPLSLPEAIRIGLNHANGATVLYAGDDAARKPVVIAPQGPLSQFQFKGEVMAMVRSIEQQYWALAQQHIQLWSKDVIVELGEEVLRREEARIAAGKGSPSRVAEARERLERFRRERAGSTAEVVATERQLRRILGLTPTDGGRIIPVTVPTPPRAKPDWDACLAQMMASQPDILRVENQARLASLKPAPPANRAGNPEAERTFLQQVIDQTTQMLARFYGELDVNAEQIKTAGRAVKDAQQRLEAQQVAYEAGATSLGNYLDAIQNWSTAVAHEAESKARYSTLIIALEEAQGTLLSSKNIVLADLTTAAEARRPEPAAKVDAETKPASLTTASTAPAVGPAKAPQTFTLRLPVSPSTTVQVRVSAAWVPGAARVLERTTK